MIVTMYLRPDGRTQEVEIANVYEEDAEWFEENAIEVSMEDIGGMYAVYGSTGVIDDEGEEVEMIVLSNGGSCEETLNNLRKEIEEFWEEG